jgi:predicted Rossmann-fold nucleotide-binding protein
LGEQGHTVLTGGYVGTMEAVSRGAAAAGGHVVGVTCDEIQAWRASAPNAWIAEELRFPSLRLRLMALIDQCDAAMALPGGPGTLAEISMMWSHLLTGAIPPRPLVLIGPGWKATFEAFFAALGAYTPEAQRRWLAFAPDIQNAVQLIQPENRLHD